MMLNTRELTPREDAWPTRSPGDRTTPRPLICYRIDHAGLDQRVDASYSGQRCSRRRRGHATAASARGWALPTRFSTPLEGQILIELTDPNARRARSVGKHQAQLEVTVTAHAQIRPTGASAPGPGARRKASSMGASVQLLRAHITIPMHESERLGVSHEQADDLLLAAAALLGALAEARVASAQSGRESAAAERHAPGRYLGIDGVQVLEHQLSPRAIRWSPASNEKSRWIELVEVLTGTIRTIAATAVDRNSAAFRTEYLLGTTAPADYQYVNPYHRPLSGTCTLGPGTLRANAFDFPSNALNFHLVQQPRTHLYDLSAAERRHSRFVRERVRFGLMTFDTIPSDGDRRRRHDRRLCRRSRGHLELLRRQPAGAGHARGLRGPGHDQEVGARNAAAPPWEGRMVAFGDPNAGALGAHRQEPADPADSAGDAALRRDADRRHDGRRAPVFLERHSQGPADRRPTTSARTTIRSSRTAAARTSSCS